MAFFFVDLSQSEKNSEIKPPFNQKHLLGHLYFCIYVFDKQPVILWVSAYYLPKLVSRTIFFLGGKVRDNFWGGFMARMNISSSASGTHFLKLEFICEVIVEISGPKYKNSSVF